METVVVAPTLDSLIEDRERHANHIEGGPCEYRLARGSPVSKKRCSMCESLSTLIDLGISWQQYIDSGRLSGRTIEIVENSQVKTSRDAEASWRLYVDCDNAQRLAQQCLLRRNYASFSCGGEYYLLRDATIDQIHPLPVMMTQVIELFFGKGLPDNFVHGNPTLASISFLGRLPVAVKHYNPDYSSRFLIQVDFGGIDSAALTAAAPVLLSRQRLIVGDEPLGAIVTEKGSLFVRPEASFSSFLREYPRYSRIIGCYLMIRALLSLYPQSDNHYSIQPSSARTLRESFEEIKGTSIPVDLQSSLTSLIGPMMA